MLDRASINHRHWQLRTGPEGPVWGEIVAGYDDLAQEVYLFLCTPKGSVPLHPEQGWDMERFRDRNLVGSQMLIAAELRRGMARDVPRVDLIDLDVRWEFTSVTIRVTWAPKGAVSEQFVTEVTNVL